MTKQYSYNLWGQLGHHNYSTFAPPSPLADFGLRATAISAGQNHTCVIRDAGELRCIGANDNGQLGVGNLQPSMTWKRIKGPSKGGERQSLHVSSVALGGDTCAVIVEPELETVAHG